MKEYIVLGIIVVIILGMLIGGCQAAINKSIPTATPTITPTSDHAVVNAAEMLILQNMQYKMTSDAAEAVQKALEANITATAIVESKAATQAAEVKQDREKATEQAHINALTEQAQMRMDQATAQARSDNATAWAYAAMRTETAFEVTVTAAVIATQTAFPMTQTAMPMMSTAQAASLLAKGTEQAGSAELVALTVERQAKKNLLDAFLPWTLVVISFIAGICAVVIFSQYRQLKRDRNGMLAGEAVKHKGGVTFIRPDLQTGPALTVDQLGRVTESGSASDFQQNTTRRAQLVEASKGKTMQEFGQVVRMFGEPSRAGGVKFVEPDMFGKLLKNAEDDLIDGEVSDV